MRGYSGDLARFASAYPGGLDQVDTAVLRYLAGLAHLVAATRARKQAAVASFLAWCAAAACSTLTRWPARTDHRGSGSPRCVDPAVVECALAAIPEDRLRDRVLFTLIARTGLRPAEALSTNLADIGLTCGNELLTVAVTAVELARLPSDHVRTWLGTHGWQSLPDHGLLCPPAVAVPNVA